MFCNNQKRHRLLFLTVNCSFSHSSLALPLLHSACRDLADWEWLRYDLTNDGDILGAVRDITSCDCDLLLTDLYLFNRVTALEILQRVHTLKPACRIAVGGPECLGDGAVELLQQYPWLDRVFRGEGEEIFREYLEQFDSNAEACDRIVPANGNAVYEAWASSPYPVEDPFFVTDKPFVQIETSRGCPMKCFYCTSGGTKTRYRSLEQVKEELQLLQAKGIREVRVLDRTFNLPQERGAAILRLFREDFPEMRFHLELHPQFLNEALKDELRKALPGQLHIEVGIQCLDSRVQRLSGRNSDVNAALAGLEYLCSCSAFETHADLLAGLPGQQWSHILDDAGKLMQLELDEIQLEVLKALPGTPLRRIACEHDLLYSCSTPYDVMQSSTMSMEDFQMARDLSRLLDICCNHKQLHPAALVMCKELDGFIGKLLDFFHQAGGSSQTVWDLKKRFLFLTDFCKAYKLTRSQNVLAFQWLQAGFLPAQGPDVYSVKAEMIPEDAVLFSGNAECLGARESRYWSFPAGEKVYYIAYNRSYFLNRPAAIWIKAL